MNKKQSNKFNAYLSIQGVLQKYRNICNSIPILDQTADDFSALLEEIKEVAARVEMDTTGETEAKVKAKHELATLASRLAGSGMAYAFDRSDVEMEKALDYAYYKIRYAKDADALQIAGVIESVLLEHRDNLAPYMITEEHLDELHRRIERFREAMQIRGGAKSGRTADYRKLALLFRTTDRLLSRKMDRFMNRLKTDQHHFYNAYRSARKIVDL